MRVKANYTVDADVKRKFDEVAFKNALNKSRWIQNKMEEYLKEVKAK